MHTQRIPFAKNEQATSPVIWLSPYRDDYFPELDDDLGDLEDPGEAIVPQRVMQIEQATPPNPVHCASGAKRPRPAKATVGRVPKEVAEHNPWVLNRMADVSGIFGLGFVCWLVLQILSAGALAWGLAYYLVDQRELVWAGTAGLVLLTDWGLWAYVRGRFYSQALAPALLVLAISCVFGIAAAGIRVLASGMIPWGGSSGHSLGL